MLLYIFRSSLIKRIDDCFFWCGVGHHVVVGICVIGAVEIRVVIVLLFYCFLYNGFAVVEVKCEWEFPEFCLMEGNLTSNEDLKETPLKSECDVRCNRVSESTDSGNVRNKCNGNNICERNER